MFIFLILLASAYSVFGDINQSDFYKLGSDIRYEQPCSQSNLNYTQKLIGTSSDLKTDMASLLHCSEGKMKRGSVERIPNICFYAGMIRASKGKVIPFHVDCPSSGKLLRRSYITSETRPCLNANYVNHTAQSFHYMAHCFDFTKKEQNDLFALFNHESGFMSNASSRRSVLGSAFCMGQMTLDLFADLNKYIQARNEPSAGVIEKDGENHWESYSGVYKKIEQKCPSVKHLVIPPEILTTPFTRTSASYRISHSAPFGCSITSNLPSCLFYSMYHYKNLQNQYRDLKELTEKRKKVVKKAQGDILRGGGGVELTSLLPIQHSEMLVLKGNVKIKGKMRYIDYIFETNEEIRRFFTRNKIEYDESLMMYKINVFPERDLKVHFLRTGHNGGGKIVSSILPTFMNKLKHRISQGSVCSLNLLCNNYRTKLLNGEPLSVQDLQREWKEYVQKYSYKFKNPEEVDSFSADVEEHIGFIRNEGVENDPTPLARKFGNLHGAGRSPKEIQRLTSHFVQRVQLECAEQIK